MPQSQDDEVKSVHTHKSSSSKNSKSSRHSSTASAANAMAVNARAKAEAARTKAIFAEREILMRVRQAELKVEGTRLEATIAALHQQCDAEAADAEANVYEAAANKVEEKRKSRYLSQKSNPLQRTSEYVKDQSLRHDKFMPDEPNEVPPGTTFYQLKQEVDMSEPRDRADISVNHHNNVGVLQPSQGYREVSLPYQGYKDIPQQSQGGERASQPSQGGERASQPSQAYESASQPSQAYERASQPPQGYERASQPSQAYERASQPPQVLELRNGPPNAPFAQRLALGWVILGDICFEGGHKPGHVNVLKTNILENERPSYFLPCQNNFQVKERFSCQGQHKINSPVLGQPNRLTEVDVMGETVFQGTSADENAIEEQKVLQIMEKESYQDDTNSWMAPLPFRSPRPRLPINKQQASQRLTSVCRTLKKRPLIPVSADPNFPLILTPATILTQKVGAPSIPHVNFDEGDLFKRQWRQVQNLSNVFWHRWKNKYLSTLRSRRKWHSDRPNLQEGDLVPLKDCQAKRNCWPRGVVAKTFPILDGTCKTFLRPITETVLLLPNTDNEDNGKKM